MALLAAAASSARAAEPDAAAQNAQAQNPAQPDASEEQTVIVYGVGGIGINAVQGARFAGAKHVIAVDPVPLKRATALSFGATHATADAEEAQRIAVDLTRGVGADKAIVAIGTTDSEVIADAFAAVGKAGVVVLLSMGGGFHDRTET